MALTISAIARTRASSSDSPWASNPPRPGRGCFLVGSDTANTSVAMAEKKREVRKEG